ncbi:6-phosphogluconolactonase [Salisaeta longa]|uniref:6-phosphogluconolactonase n=1 Tax=Salisaeta longa TaxID=503170 RepID=UPI00040BDBDA|nr:6-phosphogluconolactonase [Salisaeta longa]
MPNRPKASLYVYPNLDVLSRGIAQHVVSHIQTILSRQSVYTLAVSGAAPLQLTYDLLGTIEDALLDWSRVHVFWSHEALVPPTHPASAQRRVRDALLDVIPLPPPNIHPIPTDAASPRAAARRYAEVLRTYFDQRTHTFDLALLSLYPDGRTAGLFPENDLHSDDTQWVRAVTAPPRYDVAEHLTCTIPVLNGARQVAVVATGHATERALRGSLQGDPTFPAARIHPRQAIGWFVDEAARFGLGARATPEGS